MVAHGTAQGFFKMEDNAPGHDQKTKGQWQCPGPKWNAMRSRPLDNVLPNVVSLIVVVRYTDEASLANVTSND